MIDAFFDLLFNFTTIEDINNLHTAYITKNCLNKFRQDNGYKAGTYIKMWNNVEDNVIAWDLARELDSENKLPKVTKVKSVVFMSNTLCYKL